MPFDSLPQGDNTSLTIDYRARLEMLRALLVKQHKGQEVSYRSCLWSKARCDKALLAAGLSAYVSTDYSGPTDSNRAAAFFGLGPSIWNGQSKEKKLAYIDDVLKTEAFLTLDIVDRPSRMSAFFSELTRRVDAARLR